jgi:hypothetical protein
MLLMHEFYAHNYILPDKWYNSNYENNKNDNENNNNNKK